MSVITNWHRINLDYIIKHLIFLLINNRLSGGLTFIAKFIVTAKGKVERIEVVKGISAAFDNDVIKLINKSGGDWNPAKIGDTPVNCEMTFQLNYLDSIVPNMSVIDGKTEL